MLHSLTHLQSISQRRMTISLQNHGKRELPDIGFAASGRAAECNPLVALLPQSSGQEKGPSLAIIDAPDHHIPGPILLRPYRDHWNTYLIVSILAK